MPSFAVALSSLISAFYGTVAHLQHERTIWCIVLAGIGLVGLCASFTQQLGFGILGQKLTRRLRVLLFGHMLRQVTLLLGPLCGCWPHKGASVQAGLVGLHSQHKCSP